MSHHAGRQRVFITRAERANNSLKSNPLEVWKTPFWKVGQTVCLSLISSQRGNTCPHQNLLNWMAQHIKPYLNHPCLFEFGLMLLDH